MWRNRSDVHSGPPAAGQPQLLLAVWITTPIAYLTSEASMYDPFRTKFTPSGGGDTESEYSAYVKYNYVNWDDFRYENVGFVHERYGEWRITGAGPDTWRFNSSLTGPDSRAVFALVTYDPTNGTVSVGDIYRTQKETEPDMLF